MLLALYSMLVSALVNVRSYMQSRSRTSIKNKDQDQDQGIRICRLALIVPEVGPKTVWIIELFWRPSGNRNYNRLTDETLAIAICSQKTGCRDPAHSLVSLQIAKIDNWCNQSTFFNFLSSTINSNYNFWIFTFTFPAQQKFILGAIIPLSSTFTHQQLTQTFISEYSLSLLRKGWWFMQTIQFFNYLSVTLYSNFHF